MKCEFGITYKRKFVFITRVSRVQNVQKIKDNLKNCFLNSHRVSYKHYLIVDLIKCPTNFDFTKFEDQNTKVFLIDQLHRDDYLVRNLDEVIQTIPANEDCWVYILDDDNKIADNFDQLGNQCQISKPVLIFNIKMQRINNGFDGTISSPLEYKKALFHVDSANYLVHRTVFEQVKHANNIKAKWHDGIFMQKVLYNKISIKYVNKCFGFHNSGM